MGLQSWALNCFDFAIYNKWLVFPTWCRSECVYSLFDYQKAFDTVPHDLLLEKLISHDLNIHLVNWIASYLTSRYLRRIVGSETSDAVSVFFWNSARFCFRSSSFFNSVTTLSLSQIYLLTIFMLMICCSTEVFPALMTLSLYSWHFCHRTVVFTKLSYSAHINYICLKAIIINIFGLLYRQFTNASSHTIATLYTSLVRCKVSQLTSIFQVTPHLEYACSVRSSHTSMQWKKFKDLPVELHWEFGILVVISY